MKKPFLLLLLLTISLTISAQVQYGNDRYALRFNAGYAHNITYGSYGVFDMGAFLPINAYFEMQADLRVSTARAHAFGVQLRPKFAVPVGEFYIEDRLLTNLYKRDGFNDVVQALAVGYRMDYVSFQLGMSTRIIIETPYDWHSTANMIVEPFNLTYRLEVFVRPHTSPWNISACISNMTDYQIERLWQPMVMLGGYYNINDDWRVQLSALVKPTGNFHLNAIYYGCDVRAGFTYIF